MTKEKFGNAGATGPFAGGPAAVKPDNSGAIGSQGGGTTTDAQKWAKEIFDAGTNMPDTPIKIPVYGAGSGGGAGQGEGQVPAAAFNVVVNTGATLADENTIVDAVQAALNEIARRGYLTTYAGALPA
jgi:carbohydrate-binding DOMON domain-containing protein